VTFRRLVETLDASDVIVYLEPKVHRRALDGYLVHHVTIAGPIRYIKAAVQMTGAENRLIPLLAHELQHAVEVAEAPSVRDSESMARMFERSTIPFVCASQCYETKAAIDVQDAVTSELQVSKGAVVVAALRN
jgi:hypothetical protein